MRFSDVDLVIHSAGTVLCEPEWTWDSRPLTDYDLWFVWAGRGTMAWDDQKMDVSAGSCFCLRPGMAVRARHDPQHRLGVCFVHFDFQSPQDAACGFAPSSAADVERVAPFEPPPLVTRLTDVDLHERLLKHVVALHVSGDKLARQAAVLHLRGALQSIAMADAQPSLSGVQREHHDAIRAAARYIRENPGELFSVEALAERANYSADHFSRLFRQIVGETPKEFCIRTRLQRAQTLLAESSMSIEQIAAALGYADVFFFSRQFKQRTGMSPKAWRQRI